MKPGISQAAEPWIGRAGAIVSGIILFFLMLLWMWHWAVRHEAVVRERWAQWQRQPRIAAMRLRFAPHLAFFRARMSPHGYFGLQMTAGAIALIGASWLFGGISEDVLSGDPLTVVDQYVAEWFNAHATPVVTGAMLLISDLHGVTAITTYVALLALYLLWKRDWYWLLCLGMSVPGGMLLNELMKHAFQRVRPILDAPLLTLSSFSFPSGHVAGTALLYGLLGTMLASRIHAWRWRVRIVICELALVAMVALSRLYLGVHYLSDVLAAFAEAVAWLALCLMATNTYWQLRAANPRKEIPHVTN